MNERIKFAQPIARDMTATHQLPSESDRAVPGTLQAPRTKLVYLYLSQGEASIDSLEADLGIEKISLYPILQRLMSRGLVERTDEQAYRCC